MDSERAALRVAAVSSWILGLGFGGPCGYAIWHLAKRGEIATVLGYPTYGKGPFEAAGLPTNVPLLGAFLAVCVGETACGWLLWKQRPTGRALAVGLLPFEAPFWIGFALPFAPPFGIVRVAAVMAARRGASRG